MQTAEPILNEEKQKQKLLKASKLFFFFTMIYSLWIALLISGVYFLQLGNRWAVLTIEQWILSGIILVSLIIALEVILLVQYLLLKLNLRHPGTRKKKEYVQGRRVYRYTLPTDATGGIFSKTFIPIDEDHVLNLRYQMIPPNDLWGKKQES